MKQKFDIYGMTCASCQAAVDRAVKKLGVNEVNVNLINESMSVEYDPNKISDTDIIEAVSSAGYEARLKNNEKFAKNSKDYLKEIEEDNTKFRLKVSFFFMILLMYIAMGPMVNLPIPSFLLGSQGAINNAFVQFLLTIPVIFVNKKFFISGFKSLKNRNPNMDTLIALGSSSALIYGIFVIMRMAHAAGLGDFETIESYRHNLYFESSAMILTLITLGKYFEARSKGETKASLKNLMDLAPEKARVIRNNVEVEIDSADIEKGDIIVIRPGERIPVDGEIIKGSSLVDEAAITGESIPVNKTIGDEVISATINKQGSFKFKATRVGEDTTLSQIISLVNDANETKAPIAKLADKISAIFVPAVIIISLITFIGWYIISRDFEFALNLMISVLVISCPCALGLATPMAIMVATGKSAELGLLFKNAESLENLHKVDTILLDKTGTITEGKPVVTDLLTEMNEKSFLEIAGSLEHFSEHPLSDAINTYASEKNTQIVQVEDFESIVGRGIKGKIDNNLYYAGNLRLMEDNNINLNNYQELNNKLSKDGKTSMYFANEKEVIGLIAAKDMAKNSSKSAIDILKKEGFEITMVTGDNEITAEAIRKSLNIDKKFSEVLPQDKDKVVKTLQAEGKKVAMVGDGINDAPALARADIGIAIGKGSDIAIDSADVVLVKNSLLDLVKSIDLSKATIKTIKENLFWAFFYNIILIPLAAGLLYPKFGLTLNPMFAALAMSFSSVFVCLNSLRLRGFKSEAEKYSNETNYKDENLKENEMNEVKKMIVNVDGMSCNNCAKHVKNALEELDGVNEVVVNLDNKNAELSYQGDIDEKLIRDAINEAGYEYKGLQK
ncbi:heavy metal translocating P-type ATPase [Anaerococcus degeneri]|uniref:Copper-exporting P-type ATPase n=1 Tax=Anaerococcus degeneri TaxID=361500 RepID=A0ABS7YXW8_9FIRM|nr:heavy metal translocating P-type ATPase [Anaerococcus degeneri]MBP2015076.1 Cu+-exporting ATPase [Anaerococcus degeneri]MCA2095336.1 heavy metal translocating P-type ATPase [Anaerococcus degeneri]